ncbi:hypothetical protein HIM_02023 [Hirsutella minnesotensis 3608]|nr:hypothetical protein HIM_02023 [Hirsutella minnesotensis 3608]
MYMDMLATKTHQNKARRKAGRTSPSSGALLTAGPSRHYYIIHPPPLDRLFPVATLFHHHISHTNRREPPALHAPPRRQPRRPARRPHLFPPVRVVHGALGPVAPRRLRPRPHAQTPAAARYRNGGWGAHAETRRRAHEESTGTGGASANSSSASSSSSSGAFGGGAGGMGPGSSPFHHPDLSTPHFDKDSHTRTHKNQDRRRWQRSRRAMGDDDVEFEPQTSVAVHFLIVSCILGATILTPFVYLQMTSFGKRKKERE